MSLLRRWWFWLSPWMSFGMLLFLRDISIPHCALKHPSDDKKVISNMVQKGGKDFFEGVRELNIIQFYAFFFFSQLFFASRSQRIGKSIGIWSILGVLQNSWKTHRPRNIALYYSIQCVPKGSEKSYEDPKILTKFRIVL